MKLGGALFSRWGRSGANYPYVVARVRARKPKLLPQDEYRKLLNMDVNEIARYLEEGEYKSEILSLAGRMGGALLVENATRLNLANEYRDILGMCKGELRQLVLLYLQRYDVYNVKTVLRGRFAGASDEEITRNLIPAGALSVADLEDLMRFGTVGEVVQELRETAYGAALRETVESVERLTEVENALDRAYYSALLDAVEPTNQAKKAFLNFLRAEVDAVNVKTLLRLRAAGVEDAGDLFLPGGREIEAETFRRLLRGAPQDVVTELESTRLSDHLDGIRTFAETGDLNAAVTSLDRYLVRIAEPFSARFPLSILPVVDYLLRKRREVDNLRIVAYGKATGIKESTLEGLVIV